MRCRSIIFGSLLALLLSAAWGQDTLSRSWNQDKLAERAGESRFQYGREPAPEALAETDQGADPAFDWRWVFYTLLALGLGGLAYLILRRTWVSSGRSLATTASPTIETQEELSRQDFSSLIQQAEAQNDYRLAIRYHFLSLLKGLSLSQLIQWQPHKTDRQYLHEVQRNDLREALEPLIVAYEYAWYGEYLPTPDRYQALSQRFQAFRQRLPQGRSGA